jgi:hypothetical protein
MIALVVWLRTTGVVMVGQLMVGEGELVRAEGYSPATKRIWVMVGPHEDWVDAGSLEVAEPPPTSWERLAGSEGAL